MIDIYDKETDSFHDANIVTLWDDGSDAVVPVEERLATEALAAVIINFDIDGIEEYKELVGGLYGDGYKFAPKKLDLDLKNQTTPPAYPSIEEPQILELKAPVSLAICLFRGQ